ncbi:hypothetical protein B0A68_00805 [Flavobacterium reichenbachii]|uniref:Uncharacterized protein n=1 Tax=Flavobacterium reichenbachii TaxID=362418 RepID=A0A085ZQU4_9FLAO|nr:hypothetical protein IW19_15405 [Flavobacterium reichenbachii]OXB18593.1 hypothetical protein B0A68_00805 [Flavobacterium reichenbachii]
MISLCGSPPAGFVEFIVVLLVLILVFLIFTHYKIYNSQYYTEEFVYFSTGKKLMLYLLFLAVNLCIIPVVTLITVFLYVQF